MDNVASTVFFDFLKQELEGIAMTSNRKLQLSAAAVLANGLLALFSMAPNSALAAGCSSNNYTFCFCDPTFCRTVAGCTVTGVCAQIGCGGEERTFCEYN